MRNEFKALITSMTLVLTLSGCGIPKPVTSVPVGGNVSLLTRIAAGLFTRAAMDDFIWEGAAVESIPIEQEIANAVNDPNLSAAIAIATATHLIETTGARVIRITLVGETKPRIFFCRKDIASDCEVPVNAAVRVFAAPVSVENYGFLVVHRITQMTGK